MSTQSPTIPDAVVASAGLAFKESVLRGDKFPRAIRAALEVVDLDEARAEGWDRAKEHVLELVGYPDQGWVNPYRTQPDHPRQTAETVT